VKGGVSNFEEAVHVAT